TPFLFLCLPTTNSYTPHSPYSPYSPYSRMSSDASLPQGSPRIGLDELQRGARPDNRGEVSEPYMGHRESVEQMRARQAAEEREFYRNGFLERSSIRENLKNMQDRDTMEKQEIRDGLRYITETAKQPETE